MKQSWNPEIEKKYRLLSEDDAKNVAMRAADSGLIEDYYVTEKDWIPDFEGFKMKDQGVILRIRTMEYTSGSGPDWVMTLKIKHQADGVHQNKELEMSSEDPTNKAEIVDFMAEHFGCVLDLDRLANEGRRYGQTVGLVEHRMYLEKRRRQYHDTLHHIVLAIDELPAPAGWFSEIELDKGTDFSDWEQRLGLQQATLESRDYGEIVKDLHLNPERQLAFEHIVTL